MTRKPKRWQGAGVLFIIFLALVGCVACSFGAFPGLSRAAWQSSDDELRGVWIQDKSLTTPTDIDLVLQRVKAGRFNAIFVNVYSDGRTLYPSTLVEQLPKVQPGFDPLAYLITQAHQNEIKVHAWFIVGRVGRSKDSPFLAQHPDWGLVGPDGKTTPWLNFIRPDVREFIRDLMIEAVENYDIDGIHFDYTRYPGSEWGFDPYSKTAFDEKYHLDLDQLRYADLPAYGVFEGNPLTNPGSAQLLASFHNGLPAVTLNRHGNGEALLLNWDVLDRNVAIGSEILQRALHLWLEPPGPVFVLHSETNAKSYDYVDFDKAMAWLKDLGWDPRSVEENGLTDLTGGSVLIMPNVYLISSDLADALEVFVNRGGRVIFFDGPTFSIQHDKLRVVTGMQGRGSHFNKMLLMTPGEPHSMIPVSDRSSDIHLYQNHDAFFKEFRRQSINTLIRDVYRRVKRANPNVEISVTMTSDQIEANQRYLQDWSAWLEGGYVDFLVPRGYVEQTTELLPVIRAWGPFMNRQNQITIGLISYKDVEDFGMPKPPDKLLAEISLVDKGGLSGIILFDLEHMSDEQLEALAEGPFSGQP